MGGVHIPEEGLTMDEIIDVEYTPKRKSRAGDGGTYLVVADDTDEFKIALRYACEMAKNRRARVGILRIVEDQDFQHWGAVEQRMKKELREQAEKYLWSVAKAANELNGTMPSLYIAEGDKGEAVLQTIDADEYIIQLVLGGGVEHSTPGPLVSFCVGKGLGRLKVPVVVVPGHIKEFS
ncbi:MAG: universal stress protein [Micavibrio aeruginosavorus]|uniref:Universal stress protein n=1 Tax=Micavibrio aeruginosavorus TaxID=349221 RepID=A0A2W4ZWC5_9BACT|nr:MAG: universal stress protein [Micavibrio aeruginosavorus]